VVVRDVEFEFDNPPKELKPGAAVQASVLAAAKPAKSSAGVNK